MKPKSKHVSPAATPRLLGVHAVLDLLSLSRATLYSMVKAGQFPKPVQVTENRVAWREREVRDWIESRETVTWAA
jgi:prophage regulatory protein